MITQWDKAITALIMAVLSILNLWFGLGITDATGGTVSTTTGTILSALTPLLVYLIPNKR